MQYTMPLIDDILATAGEAHVMSKLDLAKVFYQVTVEEGLRDMITFCSLFVEIQV